MPKYRLVFQKTGSAKWLSHLDVMHTFARAFLRAGIPLKHSEGFNPHPKISIAHPLPVGVEGYGELLDFEADCPSLERVPELLNAALPVGLRAIRAYPPQAAASEIALALYRLTFEYDNGAPTPERLADFFAQETIPVVKRSKKGETEINLRDAYLSFVARDAGEGRIEAEVVLDAARAPVNPKYFESALAETSLKPNYMAATREKFLDTTEKDFE